jgi:hypothetical protein
MFAQVSGLRSNSRARSRSAAAKLHVAPSGHPVRPDEVTSPVASGADQLRVTDVTEHPAREGKLYCCVVIDAWSRRVAGWAIDSSQSADLATSALDLPEPGTGRDHPRRPRRPVHLLDLHRASPPGRAPALPGQRRDDGTIDVHSEEGRGSAFHIYLPPLSSR